MLPGRHVELPAMPGTRDDATRQSSLGEWAALVRANAVQGMKCSIQVEQGDDAITGNTFDGLAGWAVGHMADQSPVVHGVNPGGNVVLVLGRGKAYGHVGLLLSHARVDWLGRLFACTGRSRFSLPASMHPPILIGCFPDHLLQSLIVPLRQCLDVGE